MLDPKAFVEAFRRSSPYINAHRGKTFVVMFGGAAVTSPDFQGLIHDLALLNLLGIRLVAVHGARPQIEGRLRERRAEIRYVNGLRLTDAGAMPCVKEAVAEVRLEVEARLTMGLSNTRFHGVRTRVASGNVVIARPLGVVEGLDYGFTGEVRRVDAAAIRGWLDGNAVVLLSPLGYSLTGEVFNLHAQEVAIAAAIALGADKLLFLADVPSLGDADGNPLREMSPAEAARLAEAEPDATAARYLSHAVRACGSGVRRVHLVNRRVDGALLQELFTRDGIGTLIASDLYDELRPAQVEDVGAILELISPLEQEGILVRRSRDRLENEIDRFTVQERDRAIVGCAALHPWVEEQVGELACLAVHPDYRDTGRAEQLLHHIEERARERGLRQLFVLTTRSAHWFRERGFDEASLSAVPAGRRGSIDRQRNSKIFVKPL